MNNSNVTQKLSNCHSNCFMKCHFSIALNCEDKENPLDKQS